MNDRELATVLAALRQFQRGRGGFDHPEWSEHFAEVKPLTNVQIDALCERLNSTPDAPRMLITVSGGVAEALTSPGVVYDIVDYDNIKAGDGPVILGRHWIPFFQKVLSKAQRDQFKGFVKFEPLRGVGDGDHGIE